VLTIWGQTGQFSADGSGVESSAMYRWWWSMVPMCRFVHGPPSLELIHGLQPRFQGDQFESFRRLVLAMAFPWDRRNVAHLYPDPRQPLLSGATRGPKAALRPQSLARQRTLHSQPGETRDGIITDAKPAPQGQVLEAVASEYSPDNRHVLLGPLVWVWHAEVPPGGEPDGLRLSVNQAHGPALVLQW
jgi:hypothetical protein